MKSDLPAPHLETCILSRPELLAPVRAMLEKLAARIGFDEIACGHLALAIDEALTNIIRHGYNNNPDQNIWISAWELSDPTGLRIQIDDLAPQVEVSQLKGRDLDDIRPGGLGTLIEALQITRAQKTKFIVCNLSARVRSVFELSRLTTVLTVVDSHEQALLA